MTALASVSAAAFTASAVKQLTSLSLNPDHDPLKALTNMATLPITNLARSVAGQHIVPAMQLAGSQAGGQISSAMSGAIANSFRPQIVKMLEGFGISKTHANAAVSALSVAISNSGQPVGGHVGKMIGNNLLNRLGTV